MKYFLIFLILVEFVGISFADSDCQSSICIIESSWDGTQFVNPGDTYWIKVKISPHEKLDAKIFYYDNSILHQKIYELDKQGNVLIEYTSPEKEESLSFYRVAMMIQDDTSKVAGDVFRVGDVHPDDLIRVHTNSSLHNAKIGQTIQLQFHSNDRWGCL